MTTQEKGREGQQPGQGQPGQGQPGHGQPGQDKDKQRQGQQQQEPGRHPQPGGGQGERNR
jgi:hypothetical protein